MNDRRAGFLWEDERALTDAYDSMPVPATGARDVDLSEMRNPTEVKSRMKGDIASPAELRKTLETLHRDLKRIEVYHRHVRDQPGGRWDWQDRILPQIQPEVERVSEALEGWQKGAERTGKEQVRNLLRNAFRPLHDGLDEIVAVKDGEYTYEEEMMASAGEEGAPEDLVQDYRELEARRRAVLALLKEAELRVIFHYIDAFENDPLPDRTKGGNEWSWWASRYLETEYGLVEKHGWGYRLTERGHRVEIVLRNLEELSLQKRLGLGSISTAEAVLQLLPYHLQADRWEAWEGR